MRKNKLIGANTDGLGGISSFLANHMNLDLDNFASGKIATVVGTGGTAKAIAVYLSKAIGKSGKIFIAGRSQDKLIHLEKNALILLHQNLFCSMILQMLFHYQIL